MEYLSYLIWEMLTFWELGSNPVIMGNDMNDVRETLALTEGTSSSLSR